MFTSCIGICHMGKALPLFFPLVIIKVGALILKVKCQCVFQVKNITVFVANKGT